jgi:hypothetical protein
MRLPAILLAAAACAAMAIPAFSQFSTAREDARPAGLSWRRSPIRPAAGGDSATARELFARGYGIEPSRVGGNAFSETARYEALMSAGAADPKDAQLLFQQALCAFCHVTAARERRDSGELLIVSKK